MAEQDLDHPDIDAVFEQMGGKAMPQRMGADPLVDILCLCGLNDDAVQLPCADRLHVVLAREQPAFAVQRPRLANAGQRPAGQARGEWTNLKSQYSGIRQRSTSF